MILTLIGIFNKFKNNIHNFNLCINSNWLIKIVLVSKKHRLSRIRSKLGIIISLLLKKRIIIFRKKILNHYQGQTQLFRKISSLINFKV